jgi:hypothetical protein
VQRHGSHERRQFVFVAFGRGIVLDHAPRWWERIWLRIRLLFGPGQAPRPLDARIGPQGPDIDGAAGTGDRVPRRPPDTPLAGAIALPEPPPVSEPVDAVGSWDGR